jgi:hypothetical protein
MQKAAENNHDLFIFLVDYWENYFVPVDPKDDWWTPNKDKVWITYKDWSYGGRKKK